MEKCLGFVGIILEDRKKSAAAVNKVLSESGEQIVARMGLPHVRGNHAVITLIVDATKDEVASLTARLGALPGLTVKSASAEVR
ncbi:MAG TPA: CopG family transcriptional regulator [Elusimicrobiota bacterium]|nr:CopG family transcriptional regulator [Elusimicrobiota bacterium]